MRNVVNINYSELGGNKFYIPNVVSFSHRKHNRNQVFFDNICSSGFFKTEKADLPPLDFNKYKNSFSLFKINSTLCCIDSSDGCDCFYTMLRDENYKKKYPILRDVRLAIIPQMSKERHAKDSNLFKKNDIIVYPFSYFTSIGFGCDFKWKDADHKYLVSLSFSTKDNKYRDAFIKKCPRVKDYFFGFLNENEYCGLIKNIKWGLCLPGVRMDLDAKCYRDVEFLKCGIPVAMTYKPYYPFDYCEEKDYIYIKDYDDIEKLRNADCRYYSGRSLAIYEKYFSPKGMSKLLLDIYKKEKRNLV